MRPRPVRRAVVRATAASIALVFAALVVAAPVQARARDTDRDGMPDRWERAHGLDWRHADARADADHDGISNVREFHLGSDPHHDDSDPLCAALASVLGDDSASDCGQLPLTEFLH